MRTLYRTLIWTEPWRNWLLGENQVRCSRVVDQVRGQGRWVLLPETLDDCVSGLSPLGLNEKMCFCQWFNVTEQTSWEVGKDRKWSNNIGCLPENAGWIVLAVVTMTTANIMHPTFSWSNSTFFFINSDLYRVITEFADVDTWTNIARRILKIIRSLLPYGKAVKYILF